jgi:hypothetical protein
MKTALAKFISKHDYFCALGTKNSLYYKKKCDCGRDEAAVELARYEAIEKAAKSVLANSKLGDSDGETTTVELSELSTLAEALEKK